ncbi:MAG: B12-binding domain-containing radical SAM protein [Oligoflexia bacterium]|nr:B12-binding domain-containing radical SAM protein [Oligoflexia bacterium]
MDHIKNLVVLVNLPLCNYSYKDKGNVYPATAILLIGSYLKKNGFEVIIVDGTYDEQYESNLLNLLEKRSKDIVYIGLSVMVVQIPFALDLMKSIKKNFSDLKVVIGGAHPSLYPSESLKYLGVDFVVVNEGTHAAIELANVLSKGDDFTKIKGICYLKDNQISFTPNDKIDDLKELPFFDFSLIEAENYLDVKSSVYTREFPYFTEKLRIMPILTGLGCPYRCEFCINVVLKRKYRFRSALEIITEIKNLQKQYRANTFLFLDEDFFINKKRVLEFLDLAEKESLKFNFRTWCRADHFKDDYLNDELFKRFEKIGHMSLAIGAESGNDDILRAIRKDITKHDIIRSIKTLDKTKVFARYSFMIGLENESMAEIKISISCFSKILLSAFIKDK